MNKVMMPAASITGQRSSGSLINIGPWYVMTILPAGDK
jgi:hypothetical protein